MPVRNSFLEMPEYAGLFRKMPVNASGMDFTHKCRHFPNPADNVYTNFGLILSIRSQNIEQKTNFDINQGPQLCCQFAKNNDLQNQSRSCR